MFELLEQYENSGHFFLTGEDNLAGKMNEVPDLPGVIHVLRLADGHVDIVYIDGTSVKQPGKKMQMETLREIFARKQGSGSLETFFKQKIRQEKIDAIDIYWTVTYDEKTKDLPSTVKGEIMQIYYDLFNSLPPWNDTF